MSLSRRNVLKLSATAAALYATGLKAFAQDGKKIPIGLELYSVRDDMKKDVPSTLAAVGKMGYVGVEFAGYFGHGAAELKKLLDDNHLVCPSTHIPGGLMALSADNLQKSIDFHHTLGCNWLIVPFMDAKTYLNDADTIKKTADKFNALAEKLKPEGMRIGYHAHGGDVEHKVGDKTAWEVFFANTSPDVIMQVDVGNVLGGGGDPYAFIKEFPGRTNTIHIKEFGGAKGATIGQGKVKWDELFQLCEGVGKTQWYIVEQEAYTGAPLDSCKEDLEALKKMGKA
jgi:sugar phosphate isomerase/epimerase